MIVRTAALAPLRAAINGILYGGHLILLDLCGWKSSQSEDHLILFVRGIDTKGLFHAFRRMKKDFSLLFQALFGHEKLQNWSLWHGYSQKKKRRSKGSVELRYASVFLCASRMSPFSPSLPIRNGS